MTAELIPSSIVAVLQAVGEALKECARTHRGATPAEHEYGVLQVVRWAVGPLLRATVERAGSSEIFSYDSDFDRLSSITRQEP